MKEERDHCSIDGAALRAERITYTQMRGEAVYLVKGVPAQVCPRCGEQYLSPATVDALQDLIEREAEPQETIAVPVYWFPQRAAV